MLEVFLTTESKSMLTVTVYSFPMLMVEVKEKCKRQQRTKRAENLHKHAHAVILPTDAFKWSLLERQAKKLKVTVELKEERFESFFNVTFHCKQACKLPKCVFKGKQKSYFVRSF